MEDEALVSDHQIPDDAVLYFVYRTEGDNFEQPEAQDLDALAEAGEGAGDRGADA